MGKKTLRSMEYNNFKTVLADKGTLPKVHSLVFVK